VTFESVLSFLKSGDTFKVVKLNFLLQLSI